MPEIVGDEVPRQAEVVLQGNLHEDVPGHPPRLVEQLSGILDVLDDVAQDRQIELPVRVRNALAVEQAALREGGKTPAPDGLDARLRDLDGGVGLPEADLRHATQDGALARADVEKRSVGNAAAEANDVVHLVDRAEAAPLGLARVAVRGSELRFSRQAILLPGRTGDRPPPGDPERRVIRLEVSQRPPPAAWTSA